MYAKPGYYLVLGKVDTNYNIISKNNIFINMNLQENIQRIREMMISEEMVQSDAWKSIKKTLDILKDKKKVLLYIE